MTDIAARSRQTVTSATTVELCRYFAVSVAALGIDVSFLWLLTQGVGLHYMSANAIAFLLGSVVAYLGSVFWVFETRRVDRPSSEFTLFVAIGLGGLLVNEGMLWTGVVVADVGLAYAKFAAAGTSFAFNFVVRKFLLFN